MGVEIILEGCYQSFSRDLEANLLKLAVFKVESNKIVVVMHNMPKFRNVILMVNVLTTIDDIP